MSAYRASDRYAESLAKAEELNRYNNLADVDKEGQSAPPQVLTLYVTATPNEQELLAKDPKFGNYKHEHAMREIGLALAKYLDRWCNGKPMMVTWRRTPHHPACHVPEVVEKIQVEFDLPMDRAYVERGKQT